MKTSIVFKIQKASISNQNPIASAETDTIANVRMKKRILLVSFSRIKSAITKSRVKDKTDRIGINWLMTIHVDRTRGLVCYPKLNLNLAFCFCAIRKYEAISARSEQRSSGYSNRSPVFGSF